MPKVIRGNTLAEIYQKVKKNKGKYRYNTYGESIHIFTSNRSVVITPEKAFFKHFISTDEGTSSLAYNETLVGDFRDIVQLFKEDVTDSQNHESTQHNESLCIDFEIETID